MAKKNLILTKAKPVEPLETGEPFDLNVEGRLLLNIEMTPYRARLIRLWHAMYDGAPVPVKGKPLVQGLAILGLEQQEKLLGLNGGETKPGQ